jgi:hypothetical protein
MSYISKNIESFKDIIILNKSNVLNKNNGNIEMFENNPNKLFNYFTECIFPVVPKNIFSKLNFKSNIFSNIHKFKDLKNFLMKNGTIENLIIFNKIPDIYLNDTLYVLEN